MAIFFTFQGDHLGEIGQNSEDDFPVAQVEDAKKVYGFFGALNIRILHLKSYFVCDVGGTFFFTLTAIKERVKRVYPFFFVFVTIKKTP